MIRLNIPPRLLGVTTPLSTSQLTAVALLLAVYAVTIARGISSPNDWAEIHWLVGYEHGFVKRGVVPAVFHILQSLLPFVETQTLLHGCAYLLLLIFYGVYFYVVMRLVANLGFGLVAVLMGLLFVSSPYIVMAGALNGYYDNILAVLTVAACFLVRRGRVTQAAAVIGIGVLIHENILLIGVPSVLVFAVAAAVADESGLDTAERLQAWVKRYYLLALVPALCGLAVFIGYDALLDKVRLQEAIRGEIHRHDFIAPNFATSDVPLYMTAGFLEHLSSQLPCVSARFSNGFFLSRILPPVLAVLLCCYLGGRRFRGRNLLFGLALASVVLPLAMLIVAWDTERIFTYPVFACLMACMAVSTAAGGRRNDFEAPIALVPVLVCLLAVQNLTVYPLQFYGHSKDRLGYYVKPELQLWVLPPAPPNAWLWQGRCR